MILLGLADLHGQWRAVERALEAAPRADLVLLLGDVTSFGSEQEARRILDAARSRGTPVLGVSGNCDPPEVEEFLASAGVQLHRSARLVDGLWFVGLARSLPCPGRTPSEAGEQDLADWLSEAAAPVPVGAPLILVTHQPPYQTVTDRAFTGEHVGSRSVREFIERRQPLACFTGHIHEGRGLDAIGATRIINPGPLRPGPLRPGQYAYAEIREGLQTLEIRSFPAS